MPSIVGTWKLLHATARDAAGAARPSPYGGTALGRVTFTADGRMMSVVCNGRKELPLGITREYSSYCGNYTYDGKKLVTRDRTSRPHIFRPTVSEGELKGQIANSLADTAGAALASGLICSVDDRHMGDGAQEFRKAFQSKVSFGDSWQHLTFAHLRRSGRPASWCLLVT